MLFVILNETTVFFDVSYCTFIFERELALLVALQGESSWKLCQDAVSQKNLGESVTAPASQVRYLSLKL